MIKTNIKMRVNPEQSKKVQEICFKNGISWRVEKEIKYLDEPFLFINEFISFMYKDEEEDFLEEENEEVDADLFIRTYGTCIEEKEFTYPMWFKSRENGRVVKFMDITVGEVIEKGNGGDRVGYKSSDWVAHTHTEFWEQVENPNEHLDRLDGIVDKAIKEASKEDYKDMINPEHYKIGGIETIDFMKAKSTKEEFLGHLRLTALKYLSRFGKKDNELQEIKKAKWYLDKLISELEIKDK